MIGVLTCLWRRPELSEAVLRHTLGLGLSVTAVASEPVPYVEGVRYLFHPNDPLSDKWNYGMQHMRDFSRVMVIGSDDFVPASYVEQVRGESADLVRTEDVVFYESGRALKTVMHRMGAGRVLSARLLEQVDWKPWPAGRNRKLDGGMDKVLKGIEHTSKVIRSEPIVDVKGPDSMWTFLQMTQTRRCETINPKSLPYDMEPEHLGGGWYLYPDGTKRQGKAETLEPVVEVSTLTALRNIPPHVAGTTKRVYRGQSFEAEKNRAATLKRKGLAK